MTSVEAWKIFAQTGKIIDYLDYKRIKREEQIIKI